MPTQLISDQHFFPSSPAAAALRLAMPLDGKLARAPLPGLLELLHVAPCPCQRLDGLHDMMFDGLFKDTVLTK